MRNVGREDCNRISMGERVGVGCLNLTCKKWGSCINLKSTDLHLLVLSYWSRLLTILKRWDRMNRTVRTFHPQNQSLKRSFYSFKNLKLLIYRIKILILETVSVKTRAAPTRNRARVFRVVGGDSTTEPAICMHILSCFHLVGSRRFFS